ncbi:MAG: hypothetical protein OSB02_06665 [Rhodospirillaceae bacterium]|jgi:hypothetical protein|nr:hypothetical protein [Rhodospirillaceae bacterium]
MLLKRNPLKLNALQLKTLTIIQALTESGESNSEGRPIPMLPPAHGNHFHVGLHLVMGSDATGLHNAAVWSALIRKGLVIGQPPGHSSLTAAGIAYETGMAEKILHSHDH